MFLENWSEAKLYVHGCGCKGILCAGLMKRMNFLCESRRWIAGYSFAVTCMPEIYCKIYELYKNGKRQDATDFFDKLLPVLAFTNRYWDMSIWFFKLLMYRMGYYKTPNVREPIHPMDEYQRRIAEERVELAIQLIQEVRDM